MNAAALFLFVTQTDIGVGLHFFAHPSVAKLVTKRFVKALAKSTGSATEAIRASVAMPKL